MYSRDLLSRYDKLFKRNLIKTLQTIMNHLVISNLVKESVPFTFSSVCIGRLEK